MPTPTRPMPGHFRSFLCGNLLGAVLFVPYAVAIGYGLGPYMAHVQHALGGIGRVVLSWRSSWSSSWSRGARS